MSPLEIRSKIEGIIRENIDWDEGNLDDPVCNLATTMNKIMEVIDDAMLEDREETRAECGR